MSKKHEKMCITLNYIEHFFTRCVSISAFASLVGVTHKSSAIGLKRCAITAGIKKYSNLISK